ncbi:hypothetical protein FRC02_003557 [Tulasnella sp. 418]|nr:hypothetical protein FRC02_003557 [Tulasnella sp. 418]
MVDAAVDNLSDEIEYLYTTPRKQDSRKSPNDDTSVDCGFCGESLDHFTIEERQQHCNSHVDGDDGVSQSMVLEITGGGGIAKYLRNSNIGFSGKRDKPPKAAENVFWHPLSDSAPPRNFTPCLVPLLKRHLLALHSKNAPTSTSRAVLCSAGVTHIHYEKFDWLWGCGYRNFLMACTALITQTQQPLYFAMLDGDPEKPIGLRNIQRWIEDAWQDGYDAEGAQELDRCLYQTNKWIGTGELNVAFTYRGIPSVHLIQRVGRSF